MAPQTYTTALVEKVVQTSDTKSFRFARPDGYRFAAGQHFRLTIPSAEGPLAHIFSHADSPTEPYIEVTTRLTGSLYKNTLDALEPGSIVEIDGPRGKFLFAYDRPRLAFIVGGIGITPVRSMLKYLADTAGAGRIEGQEIVVLYGSKTVEGIVYREELEEIAQRVERCRLVHVISQPSAGWEGHAGHITAHLVRSELDLPASWTFYVVGPPPMTAAMEKMLDELEVPPEQRIAEQFGGYQ